MHYSFAGEQYKIYHLVLQPRYCVLCKSLLVIEQVLCLFHYSREICFLLRDLWNEFKLLFDIMTKDGKEVFTEFLIELAPCCKIGRFKVGFKMINVDANSYDLMEKHVGVFLSTPAESGRENQPAIWTCALCRLTCKGELKGGKRKFLENLSSNFLNLTWQKNNKWTLEHLSRRGCNINTVDFSSFESAVC